MTYSWQRFGRMAVNSSNFDKAWWTCTRIRNARMSVGENQTCVVFDLQQRRTSRQIMLNQFFKDWSVEHLWNLGRQMD